MLQLYCFNSTNNAQNRALRIWGVILQLSFCLLKNFPLFYGIWKRRLLDPVCVLDYWFFCKIIIWIISVFRGQLAANAQRTTTRLSHLAIFFGRWQHHQHSRAAPPYHLYFFVNVLIYSNSVRPSSTFFYGFFMSGCFFSVLPVQGRGILCSLLSTLLDSLRSWRMQMSELFPCAVKRYNILLGRERN